MAPPAYQIGGDLQFGTAPDFSPTGYMQAYQNALNLNQQSYNNILKGYQGLNENVVGTLDNIDAAQRQGITDSYTAASGQQAQGLISRGLGNTTVANSIQRGLLADKNKADIDLTNKTQNLQAAYRSQLGLDQLRFMNSVMAKYPDAEMYMKLMQMQGAAGANRNAPPIVTPLGVGGGLPRSSPGGGMPRADADRAMGMPGGGSGGGGGSYRLGPAPRMTEADIRQSQQDALARGGYGSQGRYPAEWEQANYLGGSDSNAYGGLGMDSWEQWQNENAFGPNAGAHGMPEWDTYGQVSDNAMEGGVDNWDNWMEGGVDNWDVGDSGDWSSAGGDWGGGDQNWESYDGDWEDTSW